MKRYNFNPLGARRFGISHPHRLNASVGYRGGIRL